MENVHIWKLGRQLGPVLWLEARIGPFAPSWDWHLGPAGPTVCLDWIQKPGLADLDGCLLTAWHPRSSGYDVSLTR